MARSKSEFKIGDKVVLISKSKSEGVIVFDSEVENKNQYSVHWYNLPGKNNSKRGLYSSSEIKKYF